MRSRLVASIALGLYLLALVVATTTAKARPSSAWIAGALCVHRFEGAWNANTGNGYYGGLQMDRTFARRYGGWIVRHYGLPHRWKPRTQLLVAWRGWKVQGWGAWPASSVRCGLR